MQHLKPIFFLLLLTLNLTANIPQQITYSYDTIGRNTAIDYSNGMQTTYEYDSRNRITNIEHKDSNGNTLKSFAYTLDSSGNRIKVVEDGNKTIEYQYDVANRLIEEKVSNDANGRNTTTTFGYDDVGNMLTKTINGINTTYDYNDNDQLTQKDSTTLNYDDNGNLIKQDENSYEYDAKNRLTKVTTPTDTVEYTYDANDNRIAKTTSNGTTTYLVDANTPYAQVITESKSDGTTIEYTYGNDLLSQSGDVSTLYYLNDALGSTRALADSTGNITDNYTYNPYGALIEHLGTSSNNFMFTGEQFDKEIDSYYLRARYYAPNSARFISRDTYDGRVAEPITLNHYAYGNSNPTVFVDPSGKYGIGVTMSIAINGTLRASFTIGKTIARSSVESFFIGELSDIFDNPSNRKGFARAGGIVGKLIIDRAIASVMEALLLQGDTYTTKQGAGSSAHGILDKKIKADLEGYSWFGYGVRAEIYRYDNGTEVTAKKKRQIGSIGIDIEVFKIETKEVKLLIDLKTGSSMSKSRREELAKRAGNSNIPIIEIFVPITGTKVTKVK